MPSDEIENSHKPFDVLYYETRENEMEIMNKISKIINDNILDPNQVYDLELLSIIYKNIKG